MKIKCTPSDVSRVKTTGTTAWLALVWLDWSGILYLCPLLNVFFLPFTSLCHSLRCTEYIILKNNKNTEGFFSDYTQLLVATVARQFRKWILGQWDVIIYNTAALAHGTIMRCVSINVISFAFSRFN